MARDAVLAEGQPGLRCLREFGVLGFRVWGFRVPGSGFGILGLRVRVWDFRVQGFGILGFRVQGLGF